MALNGLALGPQTALLPGTISTYATGFDAPQGSAIDAAGNLYVVDSLNQVIRKVDTSGTVTIFAGTLGSSGNSGDNGPATSAKFNPASRPSPWMEPGNVYITRPRPTIACARSIRRASSTHSREPAQIPAPAMAGWR